MIFCFDLDNVICKTNGSDYSSSQPNLDVIKKINKLHDEGNEIIVFTARYMGRNNSDVNLAIKEGYDSTESQINGWGLKYDKLFFGKPVYDVFVDDKNFEFKIDWLDRFNKIY
tara:strand:+ start:563 stop:901 length:339 start_codon:yes stop_codon:yes gene_type:complete